MTTTDHATDDVSSKVIQIMIYKLGLEESQLTDHASFGDDLGVDSLDVLELQMELEREFKIIIPDEEGEKLRTVGSVIHYIRQKNKLKP